MNLLFTVDDRYADHMLVTLYSLMENSPGLEVDLYVASERGLKNEDHILAFIQHYPIHYHPVVVGPLFADAPATSRYPAVVYYRLLAHQYLPDTIDKILYLDADTLVINDIRKLYDIDLGSHLFGACSHTADGINFFDGMHRARVDAMESEYYYNTGILLLNLSQMRERVKKEDIYSYIREEGYIYNMIWPDQDLLNTLYGHYTMPLPAVLFNYDVRKNLFYRAENISCWSIDWVMDHVVILHFCGIDKPWARMTTTGYDYIYKHYQSSCQRMLEGKDEKREEER